MAKNQTKALGPKVLQEDRDAFAALKKITDYKSTKGDNAVAALQANEDAITTASEARSQAEADLKTKRDQEIAAQWAFHNGMLSAKTAVAGQFGEDSNEIQALGRKKKSERKSPSRKPKTPPKP